MAPKIENRSNTATFFIYGPLYPSFLLVLFMRHHRDGSIGCRGFHGRVAHGSQNGCGNLSIGHIQRTGRALLSGLELSDVNHFRAVLDAEDPF